MNLDAIMANANRVTGPFSAVVDGRITGLGEKCECIEVVEPADFYQDGMDACADGTYERDCPHADGSARVQWLRGYRDFMPIRGEWEAENHDRARMYA